MMQAQYDGAQCRRDPNSTQQALIRHNGLVFYGLAAASFLETAVPLHATALLQVFATDPEVQRWLEETWWRTKVAHGREARAYIEATWPEFDWCGAYAGFYDAYRPLVCAARDSRGPAREALVRSVAAAQASAFYRCLGNTSDHAGLRSMLHRMAADESVHFAGFRRLFARLEHNNRFGLLMAYKTIVDCAQRARDVDVRLAYSHLGAAHWYGGVPFPELEYREFVQRMGDVVRRHLPLGPAQRILFRPWWQARRLAAPAAPAPRLVPRPRPVAGRPLQAHGAP